MEHKYRNRGELAKKNANIFCATYKRGGDQCESIIPPNDRHNKKQRELFTFIECLIELCACVQLNCISIHLQFTTIFVVDRQIGVDFIEKMHSIKLKILSSVDGVQQCGILKFAFCLLLAINVVSAVNYCSMCSNHVACKNHTSVGFCDWNKFPDWFVFVFMSISFYCFLLFGI